MPHSSNPPVLRMKSIFYEKINKSTHCMRNTSEVAYS